MQQKHTGEPKKKKKKKKNQQQQQKQNKKQKQKQKKNPKQTIIKFHLLLVFSPVIPVSWMCCWVKVYSCPEEHYCSLHSNTSQSIPSLKVGSKLYQGKISPFSSQ